MLTLKRGRRRAVRYLFHSKESHLGVIIIGPEANCFLIQNNVVLFFVGKSVFVLFFNLKRNK